MIFARDRSKQVLFDFLKKNFSSNLYVSLKRYNTFIYLKKYLKYLYIKKKKEKHLLLFGILKERSFTLRIILLNSVLTEQIFLECVYNKSSLMEASYFN